MSGQCIQRCRRTIKKMLRRAQQEAYQIFLYEEPSQENLRAFQRFYNDFAKRKKN